jgi:hypothetical protein
MSTPLPPFTEPDWSQQPPEVVAWAVDRSGMAYTYTEEPKALHLTWSISGIVRPCGLFDLTNIDWRTTLRLRPAEEAKVEPEPAPLYEMHREQARFVNEQAKQKELERLAEEAWKALLANHGNLNYAAADAFEAAEAFIAEREKRRNK